MALQLTSEQYSSIKKEQTVPLPNGDVKIINVDNKDYLCVHVPAIRRHMNLSILEVRHYFEKQGWVFYMTQDVFMFFTKKETLWKKIKHIFSKK